ncbi:PTS sugar transporter subunit IIA [Necropsobacter massiliensis]|uniref:PTS sugar transporter subunit IIA n=1 Tax=Necropsobacter massiliensis TaxID=1400001 RepID=UPI000595A2D9|nr:PTS sugar transporter subunit IIA [Necropsobacter massiliensis]
MLKQSLIDNNSIKLHQSAASWQEAIKIAIDMLIASGAVEPRYYDRIIEGITNIGPYIILAPGLAMPHARPEDGVLKTAFSLVTFDTPIHFDGESDPVYMMIALAGSDSDKHMEGLMEITQVLDDPDSETGVNIDKFLRCNSADEILAVIDTALEG